MPHNIQYDGGHPTNEQGEMIGCALTLTPTAHRFRVNDRELYAWCALDTLLLPALIGQVAEVTSTCPVTNDTIRLTVTPQGIESARPSATVLSIVTATQCTSSLNGTFCGQIYFFASRDAAQAWSVDKNDIAILTVDEAWQLTHEIYIEPMMKQIQS